MALLALCFAGCSVKVSPTGEAAGGGSGSPAVLVGAGGASVGAPGAGGSPGSSGAVGGSPAAGQGGQAVGGAGGAGGEAATSCAPLNPGPGCGDTPATGICVCGSTKVQFCEPVPPGSNDAPRVSTADCGPLGSCQMGSDGASCLRSQVCAPGSRRCDGDNLKTCAADGSGYSATPCGAGQGCNTPPGGQADCRAVAQAGGLGDTLSGQILYEKHGFTTSGVSPLSVEGAFLEFVAVYNGDKYIGSAITDAAGNFSAPLSEPAKADTTVYTYPMDFYPGTATPLIAVAHSQQTDVSSDNQSNAYWHWSNKDTCLTPVAVVPNAQGPGKHTLAPLTIPEACGSGAVSVMQWVRYALYWLGDANNGLPETRAAHQKSILVMWEPGIRKSCGSCFVGPWSGGGTVTPDGATVSDRFDTILEISGTSDEPEQWSYSTLSHETGHWAMANYSKMPDEAGPHTLDKAYPPGIAYEEGWATAFGQRSASNVAGGEYDPVFINQQSGTTYWFDIAQSTLYGSEPVQHPNPAGAIDQPINEVIIGGMFWYLWHPQAAGAGPYQGLGDGKIFTALQSDRMQTVDRGYHTVDMIDFLDATQCAKVTPGASISAVSTNFGYPWDNSPLCP